MSANYKAKTKTETDFVPMHHIYTCIYLLYDLAFSSANNDHNECNMRAYCTHQEPV